MHRPHADPRLHRDHLIETDRFVLRVPHTSSEALSAFGKSIDVDPDNADRMISGLALDEAGSFEGQLRSKGHHSTIEPMMVPVGSQPCFEHLKVDHEARCVRCYRFACKNCYSFLDDWPVCTACTGGSKVKPASRPEPASPTEIKLAIIGGLIAAGLGGALWGRLAVVSGYEFQVVAWGIAVFSSIVVSMLGGFHRESNAIIGISLASSLLGILFGRYVAFHGLLALEAKKSGAELPIEAMMSPDFLGLFLQSFPKLTSATDLVFYCTAAGVAIETTRQLGNRYAPRVNK